MPETSTSGKGCSRDIKTGRFIRSEIADKLETLSNLKPEQDPELIKDEIEELAEQAEGAMTHYEEEMTSLQDQVKNLEIQVKIATLSKEALAKGWDEQTIALEEERTKLSLLRQSEVLINATTLDIKLPPPCHELAFFTFFSPYFS